MKMFYHRLAILILFSTSLFTAGIVNAAAMSKKEQAALTPTQMLKQLQAGNQRFAHGEERISPDLLKDVRKTAYGQHPGAIVLSCIDSRVPPEIIFDQNIGNVFVSRVAANVLNRDVLGGMEFATKVAGAKLIVVLGHDSCGAVQGACKNVKLGHLTSLLKKIQPAIKQTKQTYHGSHDCNNAKYINAVAANNVRQVVKMIPEKSPVIARLVKEGKVKIVGAMYHIKTGEVTFLN